MKLRYLAMLAATGALLLGADSAIARSFPTTITYDGSAPVGGGNTVIDSGHVSSPKRFCTYFRSVTLIGHYPNDTKKPLDFDLTSFRGAWATKASHAGADRVRVHVDKQSFRRHGHRKVCRAASVAIPLL
jgi:hypothetical protein